MITGDTLTLAGLFLLAAALYSSVGHAGASGYLAAMALVGMAPDGMRVTALALNVLVATIGTVSYMRAGHFDWRTFYPFAILSIPAAFVGGVIHLPPAIFIRRYWQRKRTRYFTLGFSIPGSDRVEYSPLEHTDDRDGWFWDRKRKARIIKRALPTPAGSCDAQIGGAVHDRAG